MELTISVPEGSSGSKNPTAIVLKWLLNRGFGDVCFWKIFQTTLMTSHQSCEAMPMFLLNSKLGEVENLSRTNPNKKGTQNKSCFGEKFFDPINIIENHWNASSTTF